MKTALLLATLAGLLVFAGPLDAKEPVVTETIEQVQLGILETQSGKVYTFNGTTEFVLKTPKGEQKARFADLKPGVRVQLQMEPARRFLMRIMIVPGGARKA